MKVLCPQFLILTACVAVLLSSCGSSSSSPDDGLLEDQAGPDMTTDAGVDAETDFSVDVETDLSTDTETVSSTNTETDSSTNTETDSSTNTETDSGTDTATGTDIDSDAEGSPTDLDMLVPLVAAGSDLERLITGVKRQISMTLLDLNQRISQGEKLTDQQEVCLGSFDPAMGEQLLAINCEQALATGDVSVYVAQAAFYDTEDCHASLYNGNTDNCQLQRAGMTLPDKFGEVAEGERRPRLIYAGRIVNYALTDTLLTVESSKTAIAGVFKCDIDLASGSSSTPLVGTSCTDIVVSTANYLDDVVPQ